MKTSMITIILVITIIALILTGIGGWLDLTDSALPLHFTREHAWNDATFLMLIAILLAILYSSST
jgi:hypothetical protein